jgi:hypothetical protein
MPRPALCGIAPSKIDQARAAFTAVPHPHRGTVTMPHVRRRRAATHRHAPETIGQDKGLRLWCITGGLDASAFADLRQRGII